MPDFLRQPPDLFGRCNEYKTQNNICLDPNKCEVCGHGPCLFDKDGWPIPAVPANRPPQLNLEFIRGLSGGPPERYDAFIDLAASLAVEMEWQIVKSPHLRRFSAALLVSNADYRLIMENIRGRPPRQRRNAD